MRPSRGAAATAAFGALAAMTLALAACRSVPAKSYYAFVNDAEAVRAAGSGSAPLVDRPVVVPMVEIAVPYDNDRIVYRTDEYEIKHFNYRLWVSHPQDMFQQLLAQRLERARLFRSVEPQLHSSREPYLLLARIDAVELLPDGDRIEVRLAMSMRLRDPRTDLDVWEHSFDARQRVAGSDVEVEDAVRTLNVVYNAEIRTAFGLLAGFLNHQR